MSIRRMSGARVLRHAGRSATIEPLTDQLSVGFAITAAGDTERTSQTRGILIVFTRRALAGLGALAAIALVAPVATAAAKPPKAGDRCAPNELGKSKPAADGAELTCVKDGARRKWAAAAPATTVAAAAATATTKATSGGGGTGEAIKIGIALGQTGATTANLAQDQTIGVKLAEKYFNAKSGVKIKLVIQDTGPDEQGAINAFNTLINSDKVVGIVGPTLSQQAFSADPIADRAGDRPLQHGQQNPADRRLCGPGVSRCCDVRRQRGEVRRQAPAAFQSSGVFRAR
jgi:hypothetical protein